MTNCLTSRLAKCEVRLDKLHSVFMYLASRVFAYLHEKESNAHSFGNVSALTVVLQKRRMKTRKKKRKRKRKRKS